MITNLVVDALATYRLTKLIIDDEILSELRDKAYEEIDKMSNPTLRNKLTYLLGCPWCVSVYTGAFVVGLRIFAPNTADFLSTLLAASAATGLLYENAG